MQTFLDSEAADMMCRSWVILALLACSAVPRLLAAAEPAAPVRITHDGHLKQRPVWSSDGRQIAFTRHRGGKIGLVVMAADGSEEKTISTGKLPQYDACWSPDGLRLAFTHVPQSGTQGNLDVYLCKADGSEPELFAGDRGKLSHEEYPAWSPDGKRIAFSSTFEGNQELFVAEVGSNDRTRLTNDPALDAHPAWSPDGRKIAFATNRWGDFEIAVMDADGTHLTRLTESRGLDDYPVFSPDGRRIAFTSNRDGNFEIYVMDSNGKNPANATDHEAIDNFPAWTPAGQLAFVSNRAGGFDIYIVDRP
jgi:TolB protein